MSQFPSRWSCQQNSPPPLPSATTRAPYWWPATEVIRLPLHCQPHESAPFASNRRPQMSELPPPGSEVAHANRYRPAGSAAKEGPDSKPGFSDRGTVQETDRVVDVNVR